MLDVIAEKIASMIIYYLSMSILGCIIYEIVLLIIVYAFVGAMKNGSNPFIAFVSFALGEWFLGAPFFVKLGYIVNSDFQISILKFIFYFLYGFIILLFADKFVSDYYLYDETSKILISFYITDVLLAVPLMIKWCTIKNIWSNIGLFIVRVSNWLMEFIRRYSVVKYIILVIAVLIAFMIVLKAFNLIRIRLVKRQIRTYMYKVSHNTTPSELRELLKNKFSTHSNTKIGVNRIIIALVDSLVNENIRTINVDTFKYLKQKGMVEYPELKSFLTGEFCKLCVESIDSAVDDAIRKNGEIINVKSGYNTTVLVKFPGAVSGETYVKKEIHMD